MRSRPNNHNKAIARTKSPVVVTSHPNLPIQTKQQHRQHRGSKNEGPRLGSADIKHRLVSPEGSSQIRKTQQKRQLLREEKQVTQRGQRKELKIEGNRKGKEEEDNTDITTEQSSSQHLSYVTGQYQLDSYDLFSRRKNVKFQEKIEELEKCPNRGNSNSSRNSSILKNSSRVLDRSLASSEKSISVQNSFTAVKKCKIGLSTPQETGNSLVRKKYESLLQQLRNSRQRGEGRDKYIDELFPPVQASVYSNSVYRKGHMNKAKDEIIWMRLSQLFPANAKIFSKSTDLEMTVTRGEKNYAESFLVAGMNAIRGCFELLSSMFEKEETNTFGIYLVKIYQENTWKYVIVDDLIPCVRKRGKGKQQEDLYTPLFLNINVHEGCCPQLWPFLLQKAYANYYSCYQNLCYGNTIDFVSQLTGVPFKELQLTGKKVTKETTEKSLNSLGNYLSCEGVIGVAWSEEQGLFYPLYLLKANYTGENIQLGLCDPLNGYQPIRVQFTQLPLVVSSIFIYLYREYLTTITCPVYPPKSIKQRQKRKDSKEKARYFDIPTSDTTSLRTFTLFKKTKCCLDLRQKENRFYWQCGITEYLWVRCLLLQKEYDGGYRWVSGRYRNSKHIIFQETLDPGEYILVIMVQWRQRHNKELTAVLYSDSDFLKFQRKNYVREERIIELASMDLAQRLGRLNQINKSICAYTYLCEETALIIENIINERTKGQVAIMRSINGLKSRVQILPINKEFEVDAPQEYGSLEKIEGKKVIGQSVEIDIQKGQSFTVVLRMRGGIDKKFFKVFNFG